MRKEVVSGGEWGSQVGCVDFSTFTHAHKYFYHFDFRVKVYQGEKKKKHFSGQMTNVSLSGLWNVALAQ